MNHPDRIARAAADLRPTGLITRYGLWQADLGARPTSLAARMAQHNVPGVGLAVIDAGDLAWAGGFGARVADGEAVTAQTRFQAASISKPIFALAVMRLVEAGEVDLDEDVNAYLTSWRVPANGDWRPRVTLRQLLSHTAGATVHGFPGYPASGPIPTAVQVLEGASGVNTAPVVIDAPPGTQQRYAGGGTTIAQQTIVDRLRRPLEAIMRDLVLGPVGMDASSYEQPPSNATADVAASAHDARGAPVPGGWHVYPEQAAAGLWTTPSDLARLGAELIRTFHGRPSRLGLAPERLVEMLKPLLPDQGGGGEYIGLGWICHGAGEAFSFGHTGGNEGFATNLVLFPHQGRGAVVMTNGQNGAQVWPDLLSALGREYGWPGDTVRVDSVPLALAGALVGEWASPAGFRIGIAVAGGRLNLEVPGQPPIRLGGCGDREAFAEGLNLRLRLSDSGSLRWVQPGRSIKFERTPD